MAGDLQGATVLTGLVVSQTPSSGQTTPVGSIVDIQSGVTFTIRSGTTLSMESGTRLSLATYSFSITTAASAVVIPNNSLGLVFRSSGISLVYVSGGTVYSFGSSGVGASFSSGAA